MLGTSCQRRTYKANRLTTIEKQQLRVANKELPPTLEPPTNSDNDEEEEESKAQKTEKTKEGEVNSEPAADKDILEPSNKGKEKADKISKEHIEVASEEIFTGCGSFENV